MASKRLAPFPLARADDDISRAALLDSPWLTRLDPRVRLAPGTPAPEVLRVPAVDATRVLRHTARRLADLPEKGAGDVVWTRGGHELLVHLDGIQLACAPGLVTVTLPVWCDQLGPRDTGAAVIVPFAVGTLQRDAGLVMSTLTRPAGPPIVVASWSEAATAFAWEALVQLAQQVCAAVGRDRAGEALVPVSLGAERARLLVRPMARHAPRGATL